MAKKSKKVKRKSKPKAKPYFGFIVFNDRGRYEHITGWFWSKENAANAATDYLKGHPSWSAKIVEHKVLQTISFDLTPVINGG